MQEGMGPKWRNWRSTARVRSAAEELFRKFEKEQACRLTVTWGTAPMLVARIDSGESVLSRAGIDTLAKQGKIAPGSDFTSCRIRRCHRSEDGRGQARYLDAAGA